MTGTLTPLSTADMDTWRTYFGRFDSPGPYHDPDYLALLAGNFEHDEEVAEAVVYEDDDHLIYYPFLRRPLETLPYAGDADVDTAGLSDIVSSWYYGGPISTDGIGEETEQEFAEAFSEYCHEEGIVAEFVRFDPNRKNHERFQSLDPIFNRETVPVDLSGTPEDVWENYEDRNCRAIKQARETALVIEESRESADIQRFHDIYANAMEARDADEHYRFEQSFFEALLDRPNLASLFVARYEGTVVGGFITVHDEDAAFHFLSASNPDYWDMRVNNLMYHKVVIAMQESGRSLFDFQGGRPGVFKFKKGFSPKRGQFYIGKQVHIEETYEMLVEAAESTGVDTDAGYFPAYRIEQSN
jgi:hypothetical protein